MLDLAQHRALLCYNHATFSLFELVLRAKQENLMCSKQENLPWLNVSLIRRELQLLVQSCTFC